MCVPMGNSEIMSVKEFYQVKQLFTGYSFLNVFAASLLSHY